MGTVTKEASTMSAAEVLDIRETDREREGAKPSSPDAVRAYMFKLLQNINQNINMKRCSNRT
jgi:hypothetical protein